MNITRSSSLWNIISLMTIVVYATGLFIDIMEPDAAVYAQVSMEMYDRNDLLSIYHKGQDWLDKPHFPFWMSAISYKIFGVSTFAYKFPAILFIILGSVYTFLFTRKFYSSLHAFIAVLILITAQHIIISNQDVRAEPFLTGLLIMGLYHYVMLIEKQGKPFLHLVMGSLAVACLIMTKGLFTVIPIASGIGLTLLYNKNYRAIFHWRWLAALGLVIIFLFPSLYGYYLQFDQHPEKLVFGKNNVSGVEFFLWTSQWGRFTNTGPITGKGDITYFIHTLLWAFLPWAFMAFFAMYKKIVALIKRTVTTEHYTFFGFIALFIIFSASKFQLSFYLNPLFPLIAIFTADIILSSTVKTLKVFSVIHLVLAILLTIAMMALHYFFFGDMSHWIILLLSVAGIGFGLYVFTSRSLLKKIFFATAIVTLSINFYLSAAFYPALLKYQAKSEVAHFINAQKIPASELLFAGEMESVADVILHHTVPVIAINEMQEEMIRGKYIFTSFEGIGAINAMSLKYEIVKEFADFPVTRLTGKFINRKTRSEETENKYLLKVEKVNTDIPEAQITFNKN